MRLKYIEEIYCYYKALFELHIPVDIIGTQDEISGYQLVIAPLMYMVKDSVDERLENFALQGGKILFTYLSGYVNENDYITLGGYPGKLRKLSGIWVEEIDALPEEKSNSFIYKRKQYPAKLLCDIMHTEEAEVIANYQEDFYKGQPVLTKNIFGKGTVYYMGTRSNEEFYKDFLRDICKDTHIITAEGTSVEGALGDRCGDIEVAVREKDGKRIMFLLNHENKSKVVLLQKGGVELLSGNKISDGEKVYLNPFDGMIICQEVTNENNFSIDGFSE